MLNVQSTETVRQVFFFCPYAEKQTEKLFLNLKMLDITLELSKAQSTEQNSKQYEETQLERIENGNNRHSLSFVIFLSFVCKIFFLVFPLALSLFFMSYYRWMVGSPRQFFFNKHAQYQHTYTISTCIVFNLDIAVCDAAFFFTNKYK